MAIENHLDRLADLLGVLENRSMLVAELNVVGLDAEILILRQVQSVLEGNAGVQADAAGHLPVGLRVPAVAMHEEHGSRIEVRRIVDAVQQGSVGQIELQLRPCVERRQGQGKCNNGKKASHDCSQPACKLVALFGERSWQARSSVQSTETLAFNRVCSGAPKARRPCLGHENRPAQRAAKPHRAAA